MPKFCSCRDIGGEDMRKAFSALGVKSADDMPHAELYKKAASISYQRRHGETVPEQGLLMPRCGNCQCGYKQQVKDFFQKTTIPA